MKTSKILLQSSIILKGRIIIGLVAFALARNCQLIHAAKQNPYLQINHDVNNKYGCRSRCCIALSLIWFMFILPENVCDTITEC